ncbi:hypothetical protein A5643_02925, partial [Mycobacterium sp. 1274756.6]
MSELLPTEMVTSWDFAALEPPTAPRVPASLTSFVGRARELAELERLVRRHRLVTLTGAGGVGKTRLAAQLVGQAADSTDAEIWWVDLAPITNPDLVMMAVARTLDLRDQPGRTTLDILARYIADRPMLLVLDNCEHVQAACMTLTVELLGACPRLRVLATSRQPLGVGGELTWRTPSLSLADEAIELFAERARLARPEFTVTDDNAAAVREICTRLDGVPLAIELAAARVRALSLTDIIDGLQDRFRLLTRRGNALVNRHQTLRASVDWSYALLTEPEQTLFRRLAVFRGGFDLTAVHAIAGDPDAPRYQVLDELSLLVDKSLVVADDTGHAMRYRLLETVRQYALDRLAESGEADAVHIRHRDHYTAAAVSFDDPSGVDHQRCTVWALREINNLRSAFAWSRGNGDTELALQLASALQPMWLHGRVMEGLAWFDAVLAGDAPDAGAAWARAVADKVILYAFTGSFGQIDQAIPALEIARELGDTALLARVLAACGATCAFRTETAAAYLSEANRLARSLGDDWRLCQILAWQSLSAHVAGDPATTRVAGAEGRAVADRIGEGFISRMCAWCIALAAWLCADLSDAAEQFRAIESDARAANDPLWLAYGLFGVGKTLVYQGDIDGARAASETAIEAAADVTGVQQAMSLGALVDAELAAGDADAAVKTSRLAWETCPQLDLLGSNVYGMAQAALAAGHLDEARRWADEAVAAASGGHRMILLAARIRVALAQGEMGLAGRDAAAALAIAGEIDAFLMVPDVIECVAVLSAECGRGAEAARLFGAAQGMRERSGQVRFGVYDAGYAAAVGSVRDGLGERVFDEAWADGDGLPVAALVVPARQAQLRRMPSIRLAVACSRLDRPVRVRCTVG